ncbi:hypothetical protein ACH666_00745, partial [Klebsiella pneumoniae]
LKTQPATGETYPKSDLFNKAPLRQQQVITLPFNFYQLIGKQLLSVCAESAGQFNSRMVSFLASSSGSALE